MSTESNEDGKNTVVGEFLLALARAPENVQEAVLVQGLKVFLPYRKTLIEPYPMLSHLLEILAQQGMVEAGDEQESA